MMAGKYVETLRSVQTGIEGTLEVVLFATCTELDTTSCQVSVIPVRFFKKKIIHRFWKNHQISKFMKIRPVGPEFFHADGRTDLTKLRDAYRNFSNAPTNRPGRCDTPDVLTG